MSVLSQRVLNRTLLERQLLVVRSSRAPLEVVAHLVAMQGQEPNCPYVGLWTRLADFRHEALTALFDDRVVVRGGMLRSTQHVATSEDYTWLRPLIQPVLNRTLGAAYFTAETAGISPVELADATRELLSGRSLPRRRFARLLSERFPGRAGAALAGAVEMQTAVVHPPPSGTWGTWGNRRSIVVALAEDWIGRPMAAAPSFETLVHRYLAAFGPAGVMDLQAWSGLTRMRGIVEGLRLRVYRNEQGKELFDLPDAPLADPELPVPVRFLPAFDNLLLGHADRSRVISDEDRRRVAPGQAMVLPTFLIDGFVHGTWAVDGPTLRVSPFRPLTKQAGTAVLDEAERLIAFIAPEGDPMDIALDVASPE